MEYNKGLDNVNTYNNNNHNDDGLTYLSFCLAGIEHFHHFPLSIVYASHIVYTNAWWCDGIRSKSKCHIKCHIHVRIFLFYAESIPR